MLDSNDALSIKVSKKNLVKEHVQNNLVYITSNFKVLSESILKLQTKKHAFSLIVEYRGQCSNTIKIRSR